MALLQLCSFLLHRSMDCVLSSTLGSRSRVWIDVKVRRVLFEEQSCDPPDPDVGFQERFRECTVDQVVGQQHFAEQNINNSVVVVTSPTRSEQVSANVDNLSDEEFAQALVPLNSAISQYFRAPQSNE